MLLLKPTSVCSTQKSFTHDSKVSLLISLFAFIPLICNLSLPSALHFVARIGEFFCFSFEQICYINCFTVKSWSIGMELLSHYIMLSFFFFFLILFWGSFFIFVQIGIEKSYEILCKTFDHEAKAILEVTVILVYLVAVS